MIVCVSAACLLYTNSTPDGLAAHQVQTRQRYRSTNSGRPESFQERHWDGKSTQVLTVSHAGAIVVSLANAAAAATGASRATAPVYMFQRTVRAFRHNLPDKVTLSSRRNNSVQLAGWEPEQRRGREQEGSVRDNNRGPAKCSVWDKQRRPRRPE